MKVYEGYLSAENYSFIIVASRFNEMITRKLVEGAVDALKRHGADPEKMTTVWVPGAFELPVVANKVAKSGKYDAIICVGAVIRGDTPHFDFVASEAAKGIAMTAMDAECAVSFGVVTTDTIEQAIERAGTKAGNKGWDAAMTAIEMADLFRNLKKG